MSDTPSHPAQLPFKLPLAASHGRDDLIVGETNALAVDMIDRWPDWSSTLMILAGPAGSGKSHLASIWAERSDARIFAASDLAKASHNSRGGPNFLIEDIGDTMVDETVLFHLINNAREKGGSGLITSNLWPQSWNITLPDLLSRLRAATLVELAEPDDTLLRLTLVKLFADRQLLVDKSVIDYLVVRMERSIATARLIVEHLDHQSLAKNRPITRPMAASVLARMAQ